MAQVYLTDDQVVLVNKIAGYKKPVAVSTIAKSKTAKTQLGILCKKLVIWALSKKTPMTEPQTILRYGDDEFVMHYAHLPKDTKGVKVVIAESWVDALAKVAEIENVDGTYPKPEITQV